jgi:hypothetical protein
VELNEEELKLVVAALRQVRYTFEVAHRAGQESLTEDYQQVEEMYEALHNRLAGLLASPPSGEGHLHRVK